jgi:hypothetical protein
MISAYHSLITYNGSEWEDYLERITLYDIFKGLIKEYPDKGDFTAVVKYIVYAYSVESEMIVLGSDWQKNKQKIFELCLVRPKEEFYESLVLLKNTAVVEAIHNWLEWQDQDVFKQLQTLKDLRIEMQLTCVSRITKASGENDYDQKFKNAQYSLDLKKMIKDLESELIQNSAKLKDAIKEVRETKQNKSFGLETMLKESNGTGT